MNGELPIGTHPKLAVVMIGTNDLGYTESCFRSADMITEAAPGTISRCAIRTLCSPDTYVCAGSVIHNCPVLLGKAMPKAAERRLYRA